MTSTPNRPGLLRRAVLALSLGPARLRHNPALALPLRILTLRAAMPSILSTSSLSDLLQSLSRRPQGLPSERIPALTQRMMRPVGPWRATCLYRSLTRYAFLRAAGVEVKFVIGVRIDDEELVAHAWLERDGEPYQEPPGATDGFSVAFVYPPEPQQAAAGAHAAAEERKSGMRTSKDVLLTELKDGTGVLLDLKSKFYFTLNRTGVLAWKTLASGGAADVDGLARELTAQFAGAEESAVRQDVEALVAELKSEGLILE